MLPVEAALTVAASLLYWQHIRVCLAGKQQLSDFERSGNAETSPFSRTVKPFKSLYTAYHCAPSSKWLFTRKDPGEKWDETLQLQVLGRHPPNNSPYCHPKAQNESSCSFTKKIHKKLQNVFRGETNALLLLWHQNNWFKEIRVILQLIR